MTHSSLDNLAVVIESGAAVTAAIELKLRHLVAILLPDTWTAANISLQGSYNGVDFFDIHDEDGEYVNDQAAADVMLSIAPEIAAGCSHIIIRSGVKATPVNQAAERALVVQVRGY